MIKKIKHYVRESLWAIHHRLSPRHRYHMVNTGLKPGYYDVDTRMLHACMALLCKHVECEYDGIEAYESFTRELRENPDTYMPELTTEQADTQTEVAAIYRWWKEQRAAEHARSEQWCQKLWGDEPRDESMGTAEEYFAFEDKLGEDDQTMLHRLIDVRRSMWT